MEHSPGNRHVPKAAPGLWTGWDCWDLVGLDSCEPFPPRIFHNFMPAPGTRMFQPHVSGSLAFSQPRSPGIPGQPLQNSGIPGQPPESSGVFAREPKFPLPQLCSRAPPSEIPEQPPRLGCCSGTFQQQNHSRGIPGVGREPKSKESNTWSP